MMGQQGFGSLICMESSMLPALLVAALQFVPSLPFFPANFSRSSRQVVLAELLLMAEFLPTNKTLDTNSRTGCGVWWWWERCGCGSWAAPSLVGFHPSALQHGGSKLG